MADAIESAATTAATDRILSGLAVLLGSAGIAARNYEFAMDTQRYPKRFDVMGRIPIDKPEGRRMLETWKQQPGMLGVRLTFHHEQLRT